MYVTVVVDFYERSDAVFEVAHNTSIQFKVFRKEGEVEGDGLGICGIDWVFKRGGFYLLGLGGG